MFTVQVTKDLAVQKHTKNTFKHVGERILQKYFMTFTYFCQNLHL